jgi:TPR repeat protein
MLYEGNGVKQDKKKAVKIIKEMQNAGDEEAIAFLNKMLEEDLKNFSNLDAAE